MYVPEFLTKPRNLMNGALAILPSGLALFMFERVFNQNVWWLPWFVASLLSLMLVGTTRVDELRPLYGYALIQISCFVLGFNRAWSWGLIPFIKSLRLWYEITSLSSVELNIYYIAFLRTILLAVVFIGVNLYTSREASSETVPTNKVYVKKASVFNIDRYGYKTRLLLAFMSANAMLLFFTAAPAVLQLNGFNEVIGSAYNVIHGVRARNVAAIDSLTDVLLSECGNTLLNNFGTSVTENTLTTRIVGSVVWLMNDCLYVRYFLDLMVYLFIILLG